MARDVGEGNTTASGGRTYAVAITWAVPPVLLPKLSTWNVLLTTVMVPVTFSGGLAGIDNDDDGILASSHMTN